MADHVADGQRDAAVRQRDRVEPVAARRLLAPGDQVVRRDPGLWQHRQRVRQVGIAPFPPFGHPVTAAT